MADDISISSRAAVSQLGYIGLGVSDLEGWVDFACNVLGLQDNGRSETGSAFLRMDRYHHRIELIPGNCDDVLFQGWQVRDAATLGRIADQVRAFGIEVAVGTQDEADARMVSGLIKFQDPDGLATEVYYGPLLDTLPFTSPRGIGRFCADELGLGHTVIAVKDVAAYERFYVEALGAKPSDIIEVRYQGMRIPLSFYHVNPRHHTLAIMGRAADAPDKRLNHLMLEVGTLDEVGLALDTFRKRGITTNDIGRHTNDLMISFYGVTPSGFMIEYGWGGLLIEDEESWDVQLHHASSIWGHGMPKPAKPATESAEAAETAST